jgi:hypothetical protein
VLYWMALHVPGHYGMPKFGARTEASEPGPRSPSVSIKEPLSLLETNKQR